MQRFMFEHSMPRTWQTRESRIHTLACVRPGMKRQQRQEHNFSNGLAARGLSEPNKMG